MVFLVRMQVIVHAHQLVTMVTANAMWTYFDAVMVIVKTVAIASPLLHGGLSVGTVSSLPKDRSLLINHPQLRSENGF